eukprot:m.82609 g.82609  ORF g.82609 m.82609 type:complete len:338 (+) comp50782_c0_seq1:801-1814(+)
MAYRRSSAPQPKGRSCRLGVAAVVVLVLLCFVLAPGLLLPENPCERQIAVALNQTFIVADPVPVAWTMHVFSPEEDIHLSASLYADNGNQMFEMGLKSLMYSRIRAINQPYARPNDPLLLDIGANIGVHALFFAALGIRTHAFEPMPRVADVLSCSLHANPRMHGLLTINRFGIAEKRSENACMRTRTDNQGAAWVERSGGWWCSSSAVRLRTLDDYWKKDLNREQVFAIKMDIQGFEGFALEGAQEMLQAKPPAFIFMEFSAWNYRRFGQNPVEMLRRLQEYGYSFADVNWQGKLSVFDEQYFGVIGRDAEHVERNIMLTHTESLYALYPLLAESK